ncbi:MAG TPA: 6-phosphofructokinase [Flammeovirgaceae bacterium]|nr:6-phosphofructokinase [Flammeovirgaceae bacterium]
MKKIAVLTSGGDAPGMNACIRAVVRGAIYYEAEVYGIYQGYAGLINNEIEKMNSFSVSNILQRGGTILKSSRSEEFRTKEGRQKAYENLQKLGITGMVVIGGDGSFTGAKIFYEEFGLPIIGVPGTIDNDIYGTDKTIGFDTAVNTTLDAIDKIRDTADSHGRIFFVEVMGRDSGYIAIQSAIGGGAESVILPEKEATTQEVIEHLRDGLRRDKSFSIVVVAEKDTPGYAVQLAREVGEAITKKDIRVIVLGHIQRGGAPTSTDRTLASRLGLAAVEGLIDGHKNKMVGVVNDKIVFTPLEDAIGKDKPLNPELLRAMKILSL